MPRLEALAAGPDLLDLVALDDEPLDRRPGADVAAERADLVGHRLPHLAGAVARVVELLDQALDLVALVPEERGLRGRGEREPLDPLRRPLGAQLGGRHAPDLLRVRLEEELVEAAAEAVRHPLLVRLLAALRPDRRGEVRGGDAGELDRAELLHHVRPVQRVVEELPVPEDARHARPQEELVAHDLVPQALDLLRLREEAVAAEVEAVAVPLHGLGEPADLVLGLEDDDRQLALREEVSGGEAGGPAAEDHERTLAVCGGRRVGCLRKRRRHATGRFTYPAPSFLNISTPSGSRYDRPVYGGV